MSTTERVDGVDGAQGALFAEMDLPAASGRLPRSSAAGGTPRLRTPVRNQVEFRPSDLESLIAFDHPVRAVWAFVGTMDLSHLYGRIASVEGSSGAPAIDPAILVSLWLWATVDGVGSAREVDRLCVRDDTYRWICGGVGVNYHTLSDFRGAHADWLDGQLTRSVAALVSSDLVTLTTIAQDGLRVRASAKGSSFRQRPTIEDLLEQAHARVKALRDELDAAPGTRTRRQAAQERAAKDHEARLQQALVTLGEIEASPPSSRGKQRKQRKQAKQEKHTRKMQGKARHRRGKDAPSTEAVASGAVETAPKADEPAAAEDAAPAAEVEVIAVSTSDPDARKMKMADGGHRPAYNAQLAVDADTQLIAGVALVNIGSDKGQMAPMHSQIETRYGVTPAHWLADGGFTKLEAIDEVTSRGTQPVVPPPKRRNGVDPLQPRPDDAPNVAKWRAFMGTDAAKQLYQLRASTVECANAHARRRGLTQFNVRGRGKCKAVLLWHALAHNLMRMLSLGWLQPA